MPDHPRLTCLLEPAFRQVVKVSDTKDFLGVVLSIFSKATQMQNLHWGGASVQGNNTNIKIRDCLRLT